MKRDDHLAYNLIPIAPFNKKFNNYLPHSFNYDTIYQSTGLEKHVAKRHPECLSYLNILSSIISSPDYIGVNPNEKAKSFELIKTFSKNIQLGIKLDAKNDYLYIATLHTITDGKLQHGLSNGRLKKFDK